MRKTSIIPGLFLLLLIACHAEREMNVFDGFESGQLCAIWNTEKLLPGALQIQSTCVHTGKRAAQITLNPGDQLDSEKGTILERAELMEAKKLVAVEDSSYTYSFSLFLPQDFPITPTRLVIAQWKQYCESGNCSIDNPVLALRYEAGEFAVTLKTQPQKITLYSQTADIRNQWLNFRFQIRFSRTIQGRIQAWLNDREIINYSGVTAYTQEYGYPAPGYFYFKMGLYRDQFTLPMTIYFDDYRKQKITD